MALKHALLVSVIGTWAAVEALPSSTHGIEWGPCQRKLSDSPHQCAKLGVPRDYTNTSSGGTLGLDLIRIPAPKGPSRGSIIFNPGGPGATGINFFNKTNGEETLIMTGGRFDLIAFDPRGTGETLPFSCDRPVFERALPHTSTITYTQLQELYEYIEKEGNICYVNAGEAGDLLSTAFVARDVMQIVDALDEDGLLRYWGFSYGTFLGQVTAAMFPDRVDKMVLDGVMNPHEYLDGLEIEGANGDIAFRKFIEECVKASAGACALAKPNVTADALREQIVQAIDDFQQTSLKVTDWEEGKRPSYTILKSYILRYLYFPNTWAKLAVYLRETLDELSCVNLATQRSVRSQHKHIYSEHDALLAIRCADNNLRNKTMSEIKPYVDKVISEHWLDGEATALGAAKCNGWHFTAKERYTGPLQNIITRSPILFIGSPYDPVTPLVSARNASAAFPGSSVLTHNGAGHCSTNQGSRCTAQVIRAYFETGFLPASGLQCEPDLKLFTNQTLLSVLQPLKDW